MDKIRVGIFGYSRGSSYVDGFLQNGAEIVAVCEKRSDRVARAKEKLGENIAIYDNFDDFIEHDMDAVLLANFFMSTPPMPFVAWKRTSMSFPNVFPTPPWQRVSNW